MTQDEHDAAKTLTDLSHETVGLPPSIKKQKKTTMASRMIAREEAQPPVGSMMPPATSAGMSCGAASSSRKRPAERWDSSCGNSSNTSNSDSSSLSPNSSDRGSSGSSEEDGENGNDRCFFDEQQDQVCEASPQLTGQTCSDKKARASPNDADIRCKVESTSSSTGSSFNIIKHSSEKGEKSETTDNTMMTTTTSTTSIDCASNPKLECVSDAGCSKAANHFNINDSSKKRPQLRHHIGQSTFPRKRPKNQQDNEFDEGASSGNSTNSSSEMNQSCGYEGGKSASNEGSSDSLSGPGQGNGSGSGSDDGYYNNGKSVKFSKMPSQELGGDVDGVGRSSPTSSSDCSSEDAVLKSALNDGAGASDGFLGQSHLKSRNASSASATVTVTTSEALTVARSDKSSTLAATMNENHTTLKKSNNELATNKSSSMGHNKSSSPLHHATSSTTTGKSRPLRPAPYFYYIDHSQDPDEDPTSPISQPLYVPNFVAKMHAILIREELSNIICWMPHGRSWKIVNPKDFEIRILPVYFNHTKMSSFYRQTNGWGFRRMLKGSDKGSFYNENFLRGLPHLSKKMSRVGGIKIIDDIKLETNIAHEPNLWMISQEHPLHEHVEQDSLSYIALKAINTCILDGGPKAKMPVLDDGIEMFSKRPTSAPPTAKPNNENQAPSSISRQSDEQESSGSSARRSEQSSNSRHSSLSQLSNETMTVNAVAHARSGLMGNCHATSDCSSLTSAALSSQSRGSGPSQLLSNLIASGMLAQQQEQQPQITNNQINALNQQIRLLQQQQQSHQQQEQRQAAWNNVAQNNATMAFLSSHITNSQNAQQQHQETFNNRGPNNNQIAATFLANMFASQQGTTSSPGPSPNNIPQQQASPVARSQPRNDNIVGAQQQQYINEVPSGATTSYFNSILASQQQLQQQGYSNQSSATSTSSMSSGLADLQGGQAGQFEQLVNTLLSEHHMQQQQNNSTNSSNMSPEALRALVGQAILLGARFGADSAMNQNSSSSDSNGNNAGSSDTA